MLKKKTVKRAARSSKGTTQASRPKTPTRAIRKKTASKISPATDTGFAKLAGMSDEAIRAKTGETWGQWVRTLDKIGAEEMTHRDIARYVNATHALGGWWSQSVTVGYERIKGLRERGQRRGGQFECNKSRTFPVPVETLYRAFASTTARKKWLGGIDITVRKATPSKSVRISWPDSTSVEVMLVDKGGKSQVAIQHKKLPSKEAAMNLKTWWGERLDLLAQVLGG